MNARSHKQPTKTMRSSSRIAVFIFLLVSIWIASGQLFTSDEGNEQMPIVAEQGIGSVRYSVLSPKFNVRNVTLYGTTQTRREVGLRAEVQGRVEEILAQDGQFLKKNDPILRIEMRDRQARLKEAEARVKQREIEYEAAKQLSSKGYQAKTVLAAAKTDLEQAKKEVILARLEVDKTVVKAPFDGILEDLGVEIGELVGPNLFNSDQIATFVTRDPILVVGQVSERRIAEIKLGTIATATLVTGEKVEGIVSYIGNVSDPDTRTFKVEVEVPNVEGTIFSGITAELSIPTLSQAGFFIPTSAIALDRNGQVGIKHLNLDKKLPANKKTAGEGYVEFIPIDVGEDEGNGVWIYNLDITSLNLITAGQAFVKEGDVVLGAEETRSP